MATWIQKADFSSEDVNVVTSAEEFQTLFDSLDVSALDQQMTELENAKEDFCPWGIGINMDSDYGIHISREDPSKNTFFITTTQIIKKKILGFIPHAKSVEEHKGGLSVVGVAEEVKAYFKKL